MEPLSEHDPRQVGGFTLVARLGKSAAGIVYLSESTAGRRIALKMLPAPYASQPDARARFAQEVKISRQLQGLFTPEVVATDTEGPVPWMATRFIEGRSLYRTVVEDGPLPAPRVLEIATGVAEALDAVHRSGLVHRDLKPSTVVVAQDGAHLIGFAAAAPPGETSLTPDGLILGTVEYIAPELVLGGPCSPACDVFSLGGVLYFATTGEAPFGTGHPASLIHRITQTDADLYRIADPVLRDLVAACLDRAPERRPSAEAIVRGTAMSAREPMASPVLEPPPIPFPSALMQAPGAGAGPDALDPLAEADTYRKPPSPLRRALSRRNLLVGCGALAVIGGGAAGTYAWRRRGEIPRLTAARTIEAHHGLVTDTALTKDGTQLLSVTSAGQLLVWDVATSAVTRTVVLGPEPLARLELSSEAGTAVVSTNVGEVRVVDVASGRVRRRWSADTIGLDALLLATDGRTLVTVGRDILSPPVRFWHLDTGEAFASLNPDAPPKAVCLTRDGTTLAAASLFPGRVTLWNVASGKLLRTISDPKMKTASVSFSPDGSTLATSRDDSTLCLWKAATGQLLSAGHVSQGTVEQVRYASNGKAVLAVGTTDVSVLLADKHLVLTRLSSAPGTVTAVTTSGDGSRVAATSSAGDTHVWSIPDGRDVALLKAPVGGALALAFSPNGKVIVTGGDDGLVGWDVDTGAKALRSSRLPTTKVGAVAVSPGKKPLIAYPSLSILALVDPTAATLDPQFQPVTAGAALAFSADGRLLASASDTEDRVVICDGTTGKQIRPLVGGDRGPTAVAFSPDAATLAVSSGSTKVKLWNTADGTVVRTLDGHTDGVLDLAWSSDGGTIVTGGKDRTVRVWDPVHGSTRITLEHATPVHAVAITPDGSRLASAGEDGDVRVWTADGTPVARLTGHTGTVHALAFRPRRPSTLASAGQDGSVRIWNLPSGKGQ